MSTTYEDPKTASVDHPILGVLAERWSPRAFDAERPVEPEKLRRVLEAARWAPSSYNEQPWRFLLATKDDAEDYERLLGGLNERNQQWAKSAPVLMVTVAKKHFTRNEKPNRHAWHDVGLAMGNLLAQTTALGLHAHQMAGIQPERLRASCSIPDDFDPVAGLALGYLPADDALSDEEKERRQQKRTRRPLRETVFGAAWGEAADVVDGP